MSDEKIIDLETRIAHQEHTISALNDALTNQQAQISGLEEQVRALKDRVRVLSDAATAPEAADETPPHY